MKNVETKDTRTARVIARGEHSNHSHVVVGNGCTVLKKGDDFEVTVTGSQDYDKYLSMYNTLNKKHEKLVEKYAVDIEAGNKEVYKAEKTALYNDFQRKVAKLDVVLLKHILETNYVETGVEVWTGEHFDAPVKNGVTNFVGQTEFNPLNKLIEKVRD